MRLRRAWFQVHKWIGLLLAIVIIPLCLTGSALVWDEWVNDALNPQRSSAAVPQQNAEFYAAAARQALESGETLLSLSWPEGAGAVMATAAQPGPQRGRPVRTQLWLDPVDGRVLDKANSGEGAVRVMHVIHGSLMIPEVGRKVVGWIGVAMLISSLTGLWLWWPFKGGFTRGLRWKRMPTTSGNLHHQGGFWITIPLAILSFTGAWISFPAFFGALSGDPGGPPRGPRGFGAAPIEQVMMSPDAVIAAAKPLGEGPLLSLSWPTEPDAAWSLRYEGLDAPVTVSDASGEATPPPPAEPESTARLMRRIHDGNGMPVWWQVLVFLGGLIPAGLAVTGVMMWLRGRRVKGSVRAAFSAQNAG
ncbi:PepSY domain-containing protein [Altererythrobacter salegens]|uniref:PepSY domain-containing protein n=1 Tax=Croceibacterium salegens TaxID=1737568 RepID=A0A6I4SSM5_9SPHN|nr:PepSY domain-containing protein [Croceibacterium salegens]